MIIFFVFNSPKEYCPPEVLEDIDVISNSYSDSQEICFDLDYFIDSPKAPTSQSLLNRLEEEDDFTHKIENVAGEFLWIFIYV